MSETMRTVYIISTGGTIEKVYSEQTGTVQNLRKKVDRYFRLLRLPDTRVHIVPLMNKDSLEMTGADRERVLSVVRKMLARRAPIVITHGTDTMVETGLLLQKRLPRLHAPIVLTGAMTPLGFEGSDGLQNLTESLLATRLLAPGVYVVIHGQVFPIDRVRKDRKHAQFVWIDSLPKPMRRKQKTNTTAGPSD
jgi:L-asparaginase